MLAATVALGIAAFLAMRGTTEPEADLEGAPAVAAKNQEPPALNENPGYMGIEACAECHSARVEEFRGSRHFLAARPVAPEMMCDGFPSPDLDFSPQLPATTLQMTRRGDEFVETKTEHMPGGDQHDVAAIDFVYGSGGMGDEVFFSWKDDRLFELPVVWLRPQKEWAVQLFANTHDPATHYRPSMTRCLECHHTWFQQMAGSINRYRPDSFLRGVQCESCHGPAAEHVDLHRKTPTLKEPQAIVRPARLTRDQQIDICGQCHASSIYRKTPPFSFRPGDRLEDHFRLHVPDGVENDHVADQVRYMKESRCFLESETLTCTTCHSPHRKSTPEEAGRQACLQCHQQMDCPPQHDLPAEVRDNCLDCHMPRYQRVAVKFHGVGKPFQFPMRPRQHRIGIDRRAEQETLFHWLREQTDPESQEKAGRIQADLVQQWINEADQLQNDHRFVAAIGAIREVQRLDPNADVTKRLESLVSTQRQLDDAVPNATSLMARNNLQDAIAVLEAAIQLKPEHAPSLGRLGTLYAMTGRKAEAFERLKLVEKYDPNEAYGENMIGWLKYLDGEGEAAADAFRRADEIYPFQADINTRWGQALLMTRDWPEATVRFRKVLQIDPIDASAWQGLAHALKNQGDINEALEAAERAAALSNHQNLDILITLHDVLAKAGRPNAVEIARQALALAAKQNPAMLPELRRRMAETLEAAPAP